MEKTEKEQALEIAMQWLDFRFNALTQMVPGDPYCDACVIARQFDRALQREQFLKNMLEALSGLTWELLDSMDPDDLPTVVKGR